VKGRQKRPRGRLPVTMVKKIFKGMRVYVGRQGKSIRRNKI